MVLSGLVRSDFHRKIVNSDMNDGGRIYRASEEGN